MYRTHSLLLRFYLPAALLVGVGALLIWQTLIPWYVWCIVVPFAAVLLVALLGSVALAREARQGQAPDEAPAGSQPLTGDEELLRVFLRLGADAPLAIRTRGAAKQHGEAQSLSIEDLVKYLESDPELRTAVAHLRTALADERLRPQILAALQALARTSKKS